MSSVAKRSILTANSRRLLACGLLLLAAGVGIRLWHDHRAANSALPTDIESLTQRATAQPNDAEARIALGSALVKAGRLDDARQVLIQADRLSPHDARPSVWLGMIAVQKHEVHDAIDAFEEALRRNPSDGDVCRSLGELYERQGATAKSIPLYERAVQFRPEDAMAWRLLGVADLRIGRLARGREALQRAVKLDRADLKAQSALGSVDLRLGLLDEALHSFQTVLDSAPDDPRALAGAAQAAVQLDASPATLRKAVLQVNRAISNHSTPQCFLIRGNISLLRHRYPDAIRDLERAVSEDPNMAEAYGYLNQAYAATGRTDKARQAAADLVAAHERRKRLDPGQVR